MSAPSSPVADSMADSTVPTLAKTSPDSRGSRRDGSVESDVLTPPPEDAPPLITGKRKAPPSAGKEAKKPKPAPKAAEQEEKEKKPYCHQCRLAVEPESESSRLTQPALTRPDLLRCTKLRKHSKLQPPRACNYVWCERDLVKRYGIDVGAVRSAPRAKEGHDEGLPYTFECPCCKEECQNATCRKKKGLEPLG